MPLPILSPVEIDRVSKLVAQYILTQQETYLPRAIPLSASERAAMASFHSPALLDSIRLIILTDERVENPDFYPLLRAAGFDNLPNPSEMAAITFSNCVVSHIPFTNPLLFHELVHVEQYRQLGVPRFAELYLRGFLFGGGYFQIPLEQNAYALGDRYEKNPLRCFSVAEEVAQWVNQGRF
jgi:hypothetical protein